MFDLLISDPIGVSIVASSKGIVCGAEFQSPNGLRSLQSMLMRKFKRIVAAATAVMIAMNVVPIGLAQAKMVATDQVIEQTDPANDRTRVESFLLRDDVQKQLILLGIDPEEATSRVASLSDGEIQQIAGRLDELPAGEGGGIGPLVGAIVLIFLVLLITDLIGLTDVFPFVKKKAE